MYSAGLSRLLRSAWFPRHHRYYEPVRPYVSHRYSPPRRGHRLWSSPLASSRRFPCSAREPEPRSRRLHAGRHPSHKQAPLGPLSRGGHYPPVWTSVYSYDTSSAVHLRSSPSTLPDRVKPCLLTSTLTTRTLNPRSLRRFEACSCKPASRGPPSSSLKHRTLNFYSTACVRGTQRPDPPRASGLRAGVTCRMRCGKT